MDWNFGKIYKDVRKSKGITQNKVCNDVLSRTTLSKIENSKIMPSYQTMDYLLKQINMSFDEFEYICNKYHPSKHVDLLRRYELLSVNCDYLEIDSLIDDCQNYLKFEDDYRIEDILSILVASKVALNDNPNNISCLSRIISNRLWTRLQSQDNWYLNDLKMIGATLYNFNIESLESLYPLLIKRLDYYSDLEEVSILKLSILINLSTIYLSNDMYIHCLEVTECALILCYEVKRYDFLAIAYIRKGICKGDNKDINKGIDILNITDEVDLKFELEKEIKHFMVR